MSHVPSALPGHPTLARASLRAAVEKQPPSLAGPATGKKMNLEMLRDMAQHEGVELNPMSGIQILYLQALREAKQNTLT